MQLDDLVILAKVSHPIPFRTRPLNPLALMVLRLKARESKSLPDLPNTPTPLFMFVMKTFITLVMKVFLDEKPSPRWCFGISLRCKIMCMLESAKSSKTCWSKNTKPGLQAFFYGALISRRRGVKSLPGLPNILFPRLCLLYKTPSALRLRIEKSAMA